MYLVDKPGKILQNTFFTFSFDFSIPFALLKGALTFFAMIIFLLSYFHAWKLYAKEFDKLLHALMMSYLKGRVLTLWRSGWCSMCPSYYEAAYFRCTLHLTWWDCYVLFYFPSFPFFPSNKNALSKHGGGNDSIYVFYFSHYFAYMLEHMVLAFFLFALVICI